MNPGYFFLCNNETQQECLDRKLLGSTMVYQKVIPRINPGDKLFLYNYNTRRLHGVFIAVSQSEKNIVPEAWGGMYPWQVRFENLEEQKEISRDNFEGIVKFNGKVPQHSIPPEKVEQLIKVFEEAGDIEGPELEFRRKFPANKRADDGHFVRSNYEITIDNWLFRQNIAHGYERKILPNETPYCDFYIHDENSRDYIYVEFWGMSDEHYKRRTEIKKAIYRKYEFKLIELTPRDLDDADEVLPRKFLPYLKNKKFY